MKHFRPVWLLAFGCLGGSEAMAKLTPEQLATLPPPANHRVDFTKEIKPILEASCIKCHGRGKAKGGLSIENRDALLQGGDSGTAVVPGKSAASFLIELVSGLDPDNVMPQKGSKLKPDQVGLLRAWIDQGVAWDPSVSFAKLPPRNLFPRTPELPPARKGVTNPIDRILQPYYEAHWIRGAKPVNDRVFARRVYLDIIGLLPTPDEVTEFEADRRSAKRRSE